ncbi:MAG TPA: TonB-dependent receptor [Verrucomicrobiae bacterium]|nr:TonB-dependent receptor [Verrucomicrobiae bacterium]
MIKDKLSTAQKALQINLDAKKYGTFAEIGAGQEVARWFFSVGKASGTVAKTISAYDMAVSDAIYGQAARYVSRQRLQAMLDLEFSLLVGRLDKTRGDKCTFFTFADTVTTKHISKPGEEGGQGWLGVKFQTVPQAEPSQVIIHARALDWETPRQQEAIGLLGVNLTYAAFYHNDDPISMIGSLLDGLTNQRIEVDMIKFSGPAFHKVDNRLMALQLVEQWLTEAAMFTANGESVIPSELLYKKPVLLERGSFRPLTNPMLDMMDRAHEMFVKEPALVGETPVSMFEMTLRQLQIGDAIDHQDFLDRVDTLCALGKPVLISNFLRYHRLVTYLSRHTQKPIGLPIGLVRLRDVLDEKFYTDLPGGLMESLGQLFKNGAKMYVYPSLDKKTGSLTTVQNLEVAPHLRHLYKHLVDNQFIVDITTFNPDSLKIYSGEVLAKIHSGDESVAQLIPPAIADVIKEKKLFGWGKAATVKA